MSPEVMRETEVTPAEVHAIAQRVHQQAQVVRDIGIEVENVGKELEGNWRGQAKNIFFSEFEPAPSLIRKFSDELSYKAGQIELIKIIQQAIQWVEDLFR